MLNDGEIGKMSYRSKLNQMGNVGKSFGGYWGRLNLFLVYVMFGWENDSMVARMS